MSIARYDGLVIPGARSTGRGVFSAIDWEHLVLGPLGPEIERKAASASGGFRAYDPRIHRALKAVLGHYSQVQSENSEDTVTWSVFGAEDSSPWLPHLLDAAFGSGTRPRVWQPPKLWKQEAHPQTGGSRGPEADVVLGGDGWRYVIEAKWRSDIEDGQGAAQNMTQLAFRALTAAATGAPDRQRGVLVIAPAPQRYPVAYKPCSVFSRYFEAVGAEYRPLDAATRIGARAVTWESIAALLTAHQSHARVAQYLDWRLRLLDARQPAPVQS